MKVVIDIKGLKLVQENIAKATIETTYEMRSFYKKASSIMKKEVVNTIKRGNSPVKDQKRFVEYSARYLRQIDRGVFSTQGKRRRPIEGKRRRPINLKLSGKMLNSIKSRINKNGFTVYFSNKLAKIHSLEGPKGNESKKRKVAPFGGEFWKRSVTNPSRNFLRQKAFKKLVSKLRRF